MFEITAATTKRIWWVDLAATDAAAAAAFYRRAFGWAAQESHAMGGTYLRFAHDGREIGTAYQLRPRHLDSGVPSHWTPYLRVAALDRAVAHFTKCGGRVIVPPFAASGRVRIALVQDVVGALLGLREEMAPGGEQRSDGEA